MRCDLLKTTSRISELCRSGFVSHARKLFDEMPERDTIAWNAMISGYSRSGTVQEVLDLFHLMRIGPLRPDHYTFTAALSASSASCSRRHGSKLHALIVVSGYRSSLPVSNALIDMYGKCSDPWSAGEVFDEMEMTNEVSWCSLLYAYSSSGLFRDAKEVFDAIPDRCAVAGNTLISGLGRCGEVDSCLAVFKEMRSWPSSQPDHWTYSALIGVCTQFQNPDCGYSLHAIVIKSSWWSFVEVRNSFVSFYAKFGSLKDAMKAFASGDSATLVSWNAAIDAYFKAGEIHAATEMFQSMPEKNTVSWTSMIAGYAKHGLGEEALIFFAAMPRHGLVGDEFTFGAAVHACSCLPLLAVSRMIHGRAIRCGFHCYAYIGNGLVNLYAKCGDLEGAILAFRDVSDKDLISFNSLLFAFALHGKTDEALELFHHMIAAGTAPDAVTFVALLMVCSHSGLVETARRIFETMETVHGISRDPVHVACMVDLLGRAGYLGEAKLLVDRLGGGSSTFQAISRETLLAVFSRLGEVGMGANSHESKAWAEQEESSFVLESNMYCVRGEWTQAEMMRKKMIGKGIQKAPGCSWIELHGKSTP